MSESKRAWELGWFRFDPWFPPHPEDEEKVRGAIKQMKNEGEEISRKHVKQMLNKARKNRVANKLIDSCGANEQIEKNGDNNGE